MAAPLIATKLYIPAPRPGLVSRPRLVARLDEGLRLGHRLCLVSAPAGFGKTTLLAEWIRASERLPAPRRVAWLALDRGDNDPLRFWTHVVAALQAIPGGMPRDLGQAALAALAAPPGAEPVPVQAALAVLLNELAQAPELVVVLDDYHLIDSAGVQQSLAFVLEHQPPQMCLVIATRKDPSLPLARLRARGQLTEVRAADLKFEPREAWAFFEGMAGLRLASEQVSALTARTEGWAAGLQLAGLALRQQAPQQIPAFVQAFAGSHRFVLDYLVEEVLLQQPAELQAFLLQTSILERLSGPLCDALLAGPQALDSQQVLEQLEAANLFIQPLDDERRWFRYHRLFADLLRARLGRDGSRLGCAPAVDLHRRAGAWYAGHGYTAEAIGHALAAGDLDAAARLVEESALALLTRGELTTLLGWLAALPEETIRSRPWLCIYHAWALVLSGQVQAAEGRLAVAGAGSGPGQEAGHAAAIRAYIAAQQGDMGRTVELAQLALDLLDEQNLVVRSVVTFVLGLTHLVAGETAAAARAFAAASDMGLAGGNIHLAVPAAAHLADLQIQQGHLRQAFATYGRILDLAGRSPVAAQAHSGLGQLSLEWNDLPAAAEYLGRGIEMGQVWGNVDALCGDLATLAWLAHLQGQEQAADTALHQAGQLVRDRNLHPRVAALVAAAAARLAAARGDLDAAARWLSESPLSLVGDVDPRREQEYLILARVLLALGRPVEVTGLLARWLAVAEGQGRWGLAVELLVLQAVAHQAQGQSPAALASLGRALALAEPEGYIRTFVDKGEPMAELLALYSRQAPAAGRDYLARLLAACGPSRPGRPAPAAPGLAEPLTERELEILGLIAAGLTNQEIADRLVIALSTVKSHVNHAYGKLGAKNRVQALARARALGLL